MLCITRVSYFFFFNDTATTEIYTLSLHDALPIYGWQGGGARPWLPTFKADASGVALARAQRQRQTRLPRSEEHTSELQSPCNLVCRLLLEKKKKYTTHS